MPTETGGVYSYEGHVHRGVAQGASQLVSHSHASSARYAHGTDTEAGSEGCHGRSQITP